MNLITEKIENIARTAAENAGFFLIDLNLRGDKNKRVIEVFVDGEGRVSAEDLAGLSREIQERMDENPELDFQYRLDVSTPGTDRPLKFLWQFPKHINRKFEVLYKSGEDENKLTGKLVRIGDNELVFLNENKKEELINFNSIIRAKVIISFS